MNDGGTPAPSGQGGTPAPAPAPAPAPGPAPAPAAHFYDGIGDADLKSWVQGKNWADLGAMATSHRSLEKMIGAPADEIVRIGRAPDAATIRSVQTRLGLPADAAKYEIVTGDGPVDQPFVDWARGAFHKYGLTNDQVKGFTQEYSQFIAQRFAQDAKDYELNVEADIGKLKQEWGNGYDAQMNRASATVKALGIPAEAIDAMETAMGYGGVMRLFSNLSQKFSEDTFRDSQSGGRGTGFGLSLTPGEAKAELNRLLADANFGAALKDRSHPQHADAISRKSQLVSLMS